MENLKLASAASTLQDKFMASFFCRSYYKIIIICKTVAWHKLTVIRYNFSCIRTGNYSMQSQHICSPDLRIKFSYFLKEEIIRKKYLFLFVPTHPF